MRFFFYCPNSFETWDHRSPDYPGIGGSETCVVELSKRLARRGHEVTVYAKTPDDVTNYGLVQWLHVDKADLSEPGIWIICRCPSAIDLFETRPDQILYHQCQDVCYFDGMGGGAITEERSAKIEAWIALCPTHADNLKTMYPFLDGKILLSSNGIKSDAIKRLPDEPRDPYRLIWTSSPDRGLETTLKVFNRAREFEPRLSLHIFYGWDNIDKCIAEHGEDSSWGREKRKMLSLSGPGVYWRGRVGQRDLWKEYLRSGIWMYCTAFTETSCISCMEAQALGAIPICSPVWALRHNVKYGVSIPGDNNNPLTQARFMSALLRLVRDQSLADSIRNLMQKWARFHFDWEGVVDGYEAMMPEEALCY